MAVVFHEGALGGASRAILRVVPFLERLGWEFAFWAPTPGAVHAELESLGHVVAGEPRLLRYSWRPLRAPPGVVARVRSIPGYLTCFRRWLDLQSPDLVHANTVITIPEVLVARSQDRPTLLHVHEMLEPGLRGVAAARLMRMATDTVVAPSQAAASALRHVRVCARVAPYGVPLPDTVRVRAAARPLVVGTIGTISHRKGSDIFVEAARRVLHELPDVDFRMIGGPAPEPEHAWAQALVASARESGLCCGTRNDIFAELAEWDIFVLPSRQDTYPLAVLEAMASGLPVIGTRVGGIPEQVTAESGVLVASDRPGAVADAILDLARQPGRRAMLGTAARSRIEHDLTFERQAERLDEAYRATLEIGARRSG